MKETSIEKTQGLNVTHNDPHYFITTVLAQQNNPGPGRQQESEHVQ